MLIVGIVLGLVLGLAAGGTLGNLASIRLRRTWLLVVAVIVRYGTEALLNADVPLVETLRLPLLTSAFALLLVALWTNRTYPGLSLAFVGILSNATVIVVNGGYMPIWEPGLIVAGFRPEDVSTAIHTVLPATLDASFLLHLGPFADVIPVPLPFIQNVASVGDAFLAAGLAFFLFAGIVRIPQELTTEQLDAIRRRLAGLTGPFEPGVAYELGGALETGLTPAIAESAALERPLLLGGAGQRLASPATGLFTSDARWTLQPAIEPAIDAFGAAAVGPTTAVPIPRLPTEALGRVRQHPYVRLALNGSFSALWAGQLISLFGDRLHQLALVAVVAISTGSALATGLVFFAATLPNLLLSPIAGTFVDRWDRKEVLIVSDILRAAIVLLIPLAAMVNVVLVYPMVFAVTTISIFFRPARVAILPRIVDQRDLLTANSAMWVGETLADVFGYPLAGIFVVALGSAVPLAFWVDSATYLASATLLTAIAVRAITPAEAETRADAPTGVMLGFVGELKAGWRFLRSEATLLANTIQAAIGQFTIGIVIALTPAYAFGVFGSGEVGWQAVYGFLETGIGVGNLLGGFAIGLIGSRFGKGRMVIAGYAAWGFLVTALALTDNLGLAIGVALGQGVANMAFVIPSQTLFQERTPPTLMGRVVGFRFALVFGSMTVAMGVGAVLGEVLGVTTVLAFFGIVTMVTGLAGLFVPAIRNA
ncbi:MAG: MFS transporter [Candidatus Limnocylindrales bacterium]|nr:MFS transporter [Candidatus Limnocylindrales bacterium]